MKLVIRLQLRSAGSTQSPALRGGANHSILRQTGSR